MKQSVKIWAITAVIIVLAGSSFGGAYSGGSGSEANPYQIGTAENIIEMSNEPNDWDDCFVMIADVNMVDYTFTTAVIAPDIDNTEYHFQGIPFAGVFDGNSHTISNLTIDTDEPDNDYVGLFGQISGEQAQVKNLNLAKVTVIGGDISSYLGGMCGWNIGTISNCYSTGIVVSVRGYFTGGMCGSNSGTISNCYSESSASGGDYSGDIGGMCGSNHGTIINCHVAGSVTGGTDSKPLGGLCGVNSGTIISCYAAGPVSGGSESRGVGGLCGINSGTISNCYATGSVEGSTDLEGSDNLGGLCGINYNTISNCYAAGSVSGGWDVGGLCGYNRGTISNCYAIGSVEGSTDLGGLCGDNDGTISNSFWDIETGGPDNGLGTPLPTEDMQKIITFTSAGWDFVGDTDNGTNEIWQIPPDSYPILSSLSGYVPLELAGDGTPGNPYLISDANELGAIYHYQSSAHYKLTTDIDLTDIGWSFAPIPYFDGSFDGAGYAISNLIINGEGGYLGLFGLINSGQVINIELKEISIIGGDNSYCLGALCGKNVGGTISICYSTGIVSGSGIVGGLCGINVDGTISKSCSMVLVSGDSCLGGLCGRIRKGTISNCYSTGSVSGGAESYYIGGLCGVSGDWGVSTLGGTISNCYSTGSVSGNEYIGGLCGQNYYGTISSCFWDTETSGMSIGYNLDPDMPGTVINVVGKTTSEMQIASTFTNAGWDFIDIWNIGENQTYPYLRIVLGSDINKDRITNLLDLAILAEHWLVKY